MSNVAPDVSKLEAILQWAEYTDKIARDATQSKAENPTWHEEPTTEEKWAMWDYYENHNDNHNEK